MPPPRYARRSARCAGSSRPPPTRWPSCPPTTARAAADRLVGRGLASTIESADDRSQPGLADCDRPPADGGRAPPIAARARPGGRQRRFAAQNLDVGFIDRLAASSGADIVLLADDGEDARAVQTTQAIGAAGQNAAPAAGCRPARASRSRSPSRCPPDHPPACTRCWSPASCWSPRPARWWLRVAGALHHPAAGRAGHAADRVAGGELDTRVPVGAGRRDRAGWPARSTG